MVLFRARVSFLVLILFVLTTALTMAGCKKVAPKHSGELEADARPLTLWEVSKGGEVDYLFGTCHAGVALEEAFPSSMKDLITGADLFVMETNMADAMQPSVLKKMMLPEDQTLTELVGEETLAALEARYALGLNPAARDRLHPMVLSTMIDQKIAQQSSGPSTTGAGMLDLALAGVAQEAGVEADFLETVHEQLDLFLSRGMAETVEELRTFLDDEEVAKRRQVIAEVLSLCRQSDWTKPLALLEKMRLEEPGWNERFLIERNRNWIPRLESYFGKGSVFAAVGAGHLVGPDSVIEMLEAKGYSVRQMSGVTVRRAPVEAPAMEPDGPPMVARAQLMETFRLQLPVMFCGEGGLFQRCFDAPTERCRETLLEQIDVCGEEIGIPEVLSAEEGQDWGMKLGVCIAPKVAGEMKDVALERAGCEFGE